MNSCQKGLSVISNAAAFISSPSAAAPDLDSETGETVTLTERTIDNLSSYAYSFVLLPAAP
jgi:hypothetical protein